MYVRPSGTYNLSNRNGYEKSVITKKLRVDKIRCNEELFFPNTLFSAYGKLLAEKNTFFFQIKIVGDMKYFFKKEKVSS